jgi:DNA-binding NarL/FixJ family response regulator
VRPVRVLLVDDSSEFLRHAGAFLMSLPGVDLVGWAYLGREALDLVSVLNADLLLVDVALPGIGGVEVARRIKAQPEAPRVVLVTLYDEPAYREAAREAGADGYVTKKDLVTRLPGLIAELFPQSAAAASECH